jgi:CBS domain-containing protein
MSPRAAARLESLGFGAVFDYAAGKLDWLSAGLPGEGDNLQAPTLADVMDRVVPTCSLGDTIADVLRTLEPTPYDHCAVINEQGVVLGELTRKHLAGEAEATARVEDVMQEGARTFRPNVTVEEMLGWFSTRERIDSVLVTNPEGLLLGIVLHDSLHHEEAG